ncbi:MAG TPA: glycosyltransferase family 2 protein [Candidatus Barnesiella excrementavium]|nr:glycosyltransferase family 2 protein [Candidatus Barnesiella excrementavium]
MIKVSVCITTYNLENYIAQTLNSILSQKTSFDFEILIGDDCSTDNTKNILLAYKEKYPDKIVLHFQSHNVGVNKNDYELIYLAKGEYIAWCDGDDYWIDDYKLEKQVRILDENPQYSCVHTLWRNFIACDNRFIDARFEQKDWEQKLSGSLYIEKLLTKQGSGFRFSSLLVRKEILIDSLNNDPSILINVEHLQNDFAIFCLLVYVAPAYLLKDITVVYRIRSESLSITNLQSKRYNYILKWVNLIVYLITKYNLSQKIVQFVLHPAVSSLLYFMLENKQYRGDILMIENNLHRVKYQYSLGQKTMLLSIRYNSLTPVVIFCIRLLRKIKSNH